jgi:hypothetical protein
MKAGASALSPKSLPLPVAILYFAEVDFVSHYLWMKRRGEVLKRREVRARSDYRVMKANWTKTGWLSDLLQSTHSYSPKF